VGGGTTSVGGGTVGGGITSVGGGTGAGVTSPGTGGRGGTSVGSSAKALMAASETPRVVNRVNLVSLFMFIAILVFALHAWLNLRIVGATHLLASAVSKSNANRWSVDVSP